MVDQQQCDAYLNGTLEWRAISAPCDCAETIDAQGFVPYMRLHYCVFSCVPAVSLVFCACWLLFLFRVVASTADEYMVPTLERLSDTLRLSPNVAGVTLLALGNGAPDFFTSFASFTRGAGTIGIGSLLGGGREEVGTGIVITTLVLGSVAIIAPFKAPRRPLLRDAGFYFGATLLLAYICVDGFVTTSEGVALVTAYVLYVATVIVGRAVNQTCCRTIDPPRVSESTASRKLLPAAEEFGEINFLRRRRPPTHARAGAQSPVSDGTCANALAAEGEAGSCGRTARPSFEELIGYSWAWAASSRIGSSRRRPGSARQQPLCRSGSTAAAFSSRVVTALSTHRAPSPRETPTTPASGAAPPPDLSSASTDPEAVQAAAYSFGLRSSHGGPEGEVDACQGPAAESVVVSDACSAAHRVVGAEGVHPFPEQDRGGGRPAGICCYVLEASRNKLQELSGWEHKGTLSRLTYPLELLFIWARDLSIPLLDDQHWRRHVVAASAIGAPQLLLIATQQGLATVGGVPLPVVVGAGSLPVALLVFLILPRSAPPSGCLGVAIMTIAFATSSLWTYLLANELVAGLDFVGTALGISRSILGLTVLAWGNSIGDLVADTALARAGNPLMGAAACFGGPLFNLCIGAGVPMVVASLLGNGHFCVPYERIVPLGLLALIGSQVASLLLLPMRGFTLSRAYGVGLVCYFVAFMCLSLTVEFAGHSLDQQLQPWFGDSKYCDVPPRRAI